MSTDREVSQRTLADREQTMALIVEQAKKIAELEATVIGLSKLVAQAAVAGFVHAEAPKPPAMPVIRSGT